MNSDKTIKSIPKKVFLGISKVPIWAWMIILGITSAFASFYQASLVLNSYVSLFSIIPTKALFVVMVIACGVILPFWTRLFARVDYAVASRLYFRKTVYVPDYNLRRLPISYNDFLRVILFIYSIYHAVSSIANIGLFAVPYAIYLIKIPVYIIKVLLFVFGMFMLKPFVSPWQYKDVFLTLGLPTAILVALSVMVGV